MKTAGYWRPHREELHKQGNSLTRSAHSRKDDLEQKFEYPWIEAVEYTGRPSHSQVSPYRC